MFIENIINGTMDVKNILREYKTNREFKEKLFF